MKATLGILLVAILFTAFFLRGIFLGQNDRITELETALSEEAEAHNKLNKTIRDLRTESQELRTLADEYEAGLKAQTSRQITGYASSNFNVNQEVVVIRTSKSKTVTLTAYWPDGGTVSLSTSSSCAKVSYGTDTWSKTVNLIIYGDHPGTCIATFRNNIDKGEFNMMIVVV